MYTLYSVLYPLSVLSEVNFREGDDWCDYDEASETPMTVGKDIEYEFRKG